jgi:hypothetical protein
VGPLLPYAAGKTQVSHPLGISWAHTWVILFYLLLYSFVCVCVCVCVCVFLFCRGGFLTLDVVFLSFLLEACTLFCVC